MSKFDELIGKRLREKLDDHVSRTRSGRSDLRLADYRMIDPHVAQIAVEYLRDLGTPTPTQVTAWVTSAFNGHFRVNHATLRDHPEKAAVTMHLQENQVPMPAIRTANMIKIGGGQFMDKQKNRWKIEKAPNGEDILVKTSDTNTEELLQELAKRHKEGRYAMVKLNDLRTAGVVNLDVGDTVLYSEPSGGILVKEGVVTNVKEKSVTIQGREGALDRSYVMDIVDKSATAKKQRSQEMVDFMTEYFFSGDKAMGKKMAEH